MKNKIKAGDLIECDGAMYNDYRIGQEVRVYEDEYGLYVLGHADARYRLHELSISKHTDDAFAMCVGYSFVKKKNRDVPLIGSEMTKKLLEKQEYVDCRISDFGDDDARTNRNITKIVSYNGWFLAPSGAGFGFAVPVDMNGNEITEIEL